MADETKTPAARLIESRKAVQGLAEKAAAKLDAARTKAEAALADIKRRTSAPVAAINVAEIELDRDIRNALRSMPDKDRGERIAESIKAGDQVIRAVLSGPAWLVGLGDTQREAYRHSWRTARFPNKPRPQQLSLSRFRLWPKA